MLDLASQTTVVAAANLLLAADGRFPAGGYAHSSGLEQAIERGRVDDEPSLELFLRGALSTVARSAACFAAASCEVWRCRDPQDVMARAARDEALALLAREESARMPSAALRDASRAQGRQYLRAAAASWLGLALPRPNVVEHGVHLSMAQGLVAAELDLPPRGAALLSVYAAVTGPAAAAVKLLGLDPFAVNRVVTALNPQLAEVVDEAGDLAGCDACDLPGRSAPLLETGAELHLLRQPRMFAS